MNNSYNYAGFAGLNLSSDEKSEPATFKTPPTDYQESASETRIEQMLLNHSKYYIYCE